MTVLVKSYIVVDGFPHLPGEILHLPERQALAMVGTGVVEQIVDEPQESGVIEQIPKKSRRSTE